MKKFITKSQKSQNRRKGFTLVEMLIVVAIMIILCGIILVAVGVLGKKMRFKQCNDYAKTIFMAAQSNLTAMRTNGELGKFQAEGVDDVSIDADFRKKVGFPEDQWSEEYVYSSSEFPETTAERDSYSLVLPLNSVEAHIREKKVIIEYNPITGNVYSVFYSENDESLLSMYRNGQLPRDEDARRDLEIGYYCGSGLSSQELNLEGAEVDMQYINGQEGIVVVTVTVPDSMEGKATTFYSGLDIKLSLTGETSGAQKTLTLNKKVATDWEEASDALRIYYVLDSLADGRSFANRAAEDYEGITSLTDYKSERDFSFLPGENLLIQANVTFTGGGASEKLDAAVLASVNPMFQYLEPSGTSGKYVLAVANGRNLQNLNALTPKIADAVEVVLLTSDVDWNETVAYYNKEYNGGHTYQNSFDEAPGRALPYFVPIHNEMLFGTAQFGSRDLDYSMDPLTTGNKHAAVVGNGKKILGLCIDSTHYQIPGGGEYYVSAGYSSGGKTVGGNQVVNYHLTGLFAYVNTQVSDLTLVNPIVKGMDFTGSGSKHVATGALAGAAGYDAVFTNCGVYMEKADSLDNTATSGPKAYDADESQNWYGVSGEGAVGGLVGYSVSHHVADGYLTDNTAQLTFLKCFSAVPVSGNMRGSTSTGGYGYNNGVGGLVGVTRISNFYGCYASGDVLATGVAVKVKNGNDNISNQLPMDGSVSTGAGGLVGTSHGSMYSNCFTTGDLTVNATEGVGSFLGVMCYDESFTSGSKTYTQFSLMESCYTTGKINSNTGSSFTGANASNSLYTTHGLNPGNCRIYTDYYQMLAPYYYEVRKVADKNYRDLHTPITLPTTPDGYISGSVTYYYISKDCYYLDQERTEETVDFSGDTIGAAINYDILMDLVNAHSGATQKSGWAPDQWKNILTWTTEDGKTFNDKYYHIWIIQTTYEDFEELANVYKAQLNAAFDGPWLDAKDWQAGGGQTGSIMCPGADYIFAMIDGLNYYGEWPTIPLTHGLAYFEYYSHDPNTIHLQFDRADTGTLLTNEELRALGSHVVSDGYAVVLREKKTSGTLSVKVGATSASLNYTNAITYNDNGRTVYLLLLTRTQLHTNAPARFTAGGYYIPVSYTLPWKVNNQSRTVTYYFNPFTANSQINPSMIDREDFNNPDKPAAPPAIIEVRTARQLVGLMDYRATAFVAEGYNYVQTMDIDAATYLSVSKGYTSSSDVTAIKNLFKNANGLGVSNSGGTAFNKFQGTYTGVGSGDAKPVIANFYTRKYLGLFMNIGEKGVVSNLTLKVDGAATWDYSAKTNAGAGMLADVNDGTIRDVDIVLDGTISLKAKNNAGLLVGKSTGTIEDCDVTADGAVTITLTATTTDAGAAGLVGNLTGKIKGGHIIFSKTLTATAPNAGGCAGYIKDANAENVTVQINGLVANSNVGGFAGVASGGKYTGIHVRLTGTSKGTANFGGLIGSAGNAIVSDAIATLSGDISGVRVGGLAYTGNGSTFRNCNVTISGTLEGSEQAAGWSTIGTNTTACSDINIIIMGTIKAPKAAGFGITLMGDYSKSTVTLDGGSITGTGSASEVAGFAHTVSSGVKVYDHCAVMGSGTISGASSAGFAVTVQGSVAASRVTPALEQTPEGYWGEGNQNLVVNGTTTAAGFAVKLSGGKITNCDALCNVTGATKSGFVDNNSNGEIDGCIANVNISGGYAFVRSNTGSVANCYGWFADGVTSSSTVVPDGSSKNYYSSYFGDTDAKEADAETTASVAIFDNTGKYSKITPVDLTSAYGTLSNTASIKWYAPGTYNAYAYSMSGAYPYPMLRDHSGDWAATKTYSFGVIYYERYTSGSTRFHVVDLSNNASGALNFYSIGSTTQTKNCFDASGTISEAGYLVFCKTGSNPFGSGLVGEEFTADAVIAKTINQKGGNGFSVYKFNSTSAVQFVKAGKTVAVYPFFADAIGSEAPYQIRTADHLAGMSKLSQSTYTQTRDIIVSGNFGGNPASVDTYNGNGYKIIAASATNTLFDKVYGSINDVNITVGAMRDDLIREVPAYGKVVNLNVEIAGAFGANGSIIGKSAGTVSIPSVKITASSMQGRLVENVNGGTVTVQQVDATGATIRSLFGNVTGGVVTGNTMNLGTVTENLFGTVAGGATVSSFTINATAINGSLIATLTGTVESLKLYVTNADLGSNSGMIANNVTTGTTAEGEVVSNAVRNCVIQVDNMTSSASVFGVVTAKAPEKTIVSGCTVKVSNLTLTGMTLAGLVGINRGNVEDNVVDVTINATDATCIGGMIAQNSGVINGFTVKVYVNFTQTKSTMERTVIGGLVAQATGGRISGKTNANSITGTLKIMSGPVANTAAKRKYVAGGAIGESAGVTYTNIYANVTFSGTWNNSQKVTSTVVDTMGKGPIGKFIGYAKSGTFTNCTAAESRTIAFCGQKEPSITTLAAGDTGSRVSEHLIGWLALLV